nr:uncharacterized mitochondrial protein AtMg00810-like [Tanacetum cinerariifolium]
VKDLFKSKDPQVVVAAAKLPILNPNEFDLWKIRIELYFLMTDYSLWEVILNGDSPTPTRIVYGVVQVIAPTTAKQRLAKKNELKARETLLMALPDKHRLKFNIHKDAKSLIEAIKKRLQKLISQLEILGESISQEDINMKFLRSLPSEWKTHTLIWRNKGNLEEQSFDHLFNNLKIYEAEVKSSSTTSPNTQNIAFVSSNNTDSTNESVNVVPSVSAASTKASVSTLLNVDSLSDAVIYSFFAMANGHAYHESHEVSSKDWKESSANGKAAIRFDMSKVKCYNCHRRVHFARECISPRDSRNKDTPRRTVPVEIILPMLWGSSSSSGSNNEVASCSKACSKAYATLQSHYDKLIVDLKKSQFDILSYKAGLESVEARDNALVELRKKFKKAEKERNELKLTIEKFQTSSKNLSKLLEIQICDKTGLGYDSQVFNRQVFDCDKLNSYESDDNVPTSPMNDRYQSGEGYHVVPPPYTGTFMPPKPDLAFHDAPPASKTVPSVVNVKSSINKPSKEMYKTLRPDAPIIEDWTSDSEYESEPESVSVSKQKAPSFVPTNEHAKTPRSSVETVEHPQQAKNLRTENPKSKGHKHSWNRKASFVCKSLNHLIKDCNFYEKQMVQKPMWNHVMRVNHQNSARMTHPHSNKNVVPTAVLTRSRLVPLSATRPVTTAVPEPTVKSLRPVKHVVNKAHSPIRRPINHRPTFKNSNFNQKVTTVKVKKTLNNSIDDILHLVRILKVLPDDNYVLLRVSRENNMYNVDLKNVVPSEYLTCLFAKATLDKSNLWHRRLGHINFKTMNKLVKGIKREFSVVRNPQHNEVAERKNRTLIKAARTMLTDLLLPIPFWAEAVNIVCYVQNRILVTKPHNKTPYELLLGRTPSIGFIRPFGCLVTILNTLYPLGKFDGKADEGFLVGYSINSKAFRVFNSRTKIVQNTLHINFLENQPNVAGRNQPTHNAGIKENLNACKVRKETVSAQQYVLIPLWSTGLQDPHNTVDDVALMLKRLRMKFMFLQVVVTSQRNMVTRIKEKLKERVLTNRVNAASAPVTTVRPNPTNSTNSFNAASPSDNVINPNFEIGRKSLFVDPSQYPDDLDMHALEDILYSDDEEDVGVEADFSNLETNISVSHIPTTRVHKDHHVSQIIGELTTAPQTRRLQLKQKDDGIFISQDKYVAKILRKFGITYVKSASTPIETEKPLLKDPDGEDVDIHIYRSMIGSLMYRTSSRPDIMFAICACSRFQVTPKKSHLRAVKRIFRYLKGKPHLGLWYPKDSPFNLVGYSDSDYAGASLDRKSTTRGCQFLGCILISWQCKKQTVVATTLTEAEYVAAASCCAKVLWIQN